MSKEADELGEKLVSELEVVIETIKLLPTPLIAVEEAGGQLTQAMVEMSAADQLRLIPVLATLERARELLEGKPSQWKEYVESARGLVEDIKAHGSIPRTPDEMQAVLGKIFPGADIRVVKLPLPKPDKTPEKKDLN